MPGHFKGNNPYRDLFVGTEVQIPVLNGPPRPYINLDNAASTPALQVVQETIDSFLPYYSSVHRGTGFKSQLSTLAYEQARESVLHFLGANPAQHTCIFGKNTTEAINKLARRFPFTSQRDIVLTSGMEHHSNDLPWRNMAHTIHVRLTPEGRLDEADFDGQLSKYAGRIALVAITGASNVTGFINPYHRLAEKAHGVGAQILVDGAQLAAHRKIEMGSLDDPSHLDYVSISAHKMYAPFGTGALVGRRDTFASGDPDMPGGGTVEIVTLDSVVWADPPDRDEAGSPNTLGAIALAAALRQLTGIGMQNVAEHEAHLTAYALQQLARVPKIRIYGDRDPDSAHERLGVIPFEIAGISHFLVSSVLGFEFGIGVRSGCFCAHPYILHLLGLSPEEANQVRGDILAGDRTQMPGMVRISFGLYNSFEEIDTLMSALELISRDQYQGQYIQEKSSGLYSPQGWSPPLEKYLPYPAVKR
jgi:selenocysteine lyase/cysteine desulfurase